MTGGVTVTISSISHPAISDQNTKYPADDALSLRVNAAQSATVERRAAGEQSLRQANAARRAALLLDRLHRGGAWRFLWTPNGGQSGDKKRSVWSAVDSALRPPASWAGKHTYFGVNPSSVRRNHFEASTNDTIAALNCLYAEFDGQDFTTPDPALIAKHFAILRSNPDHAKTKDDALLRQATGYAQSALYALDMPRYNAFALAHIRALPVAPSALWFSGGGYQAVWLLAETFVISTDDDRSRAKRIQNDWVYFVGGDDGAKDIRRILRLPGTYNIKPKYPNRPLVDFVDFDLQRTYALDELVALLPEPAPAPEPEPARERSPRTPSDRSPSDNAGSMSAFAYKVMTAYNAAHTITDTLLTFHYGKTDNPSRLTRPGGKSPSVHIDLAENESFHHGSSDPLYGPHRMTPFSAVAALDYGCDVEAAALALAPALGILTPAQIAALFDRLSVFVQTNSLLPYIPDEHLTKTKYGPQHRTRGDDVRRFLAVLEIMRKAGRIDEVSINAYAIVRGHNAAGVPVQLESHKNIAKFFKRFAYFFDVRPVAKAHTWLISLSPATEVDINTFPLTTNPIANESGKVLISTFLHWKNDDQFQKGTSVVVRDRLRGEAIEEVTKEQGTADQARTKEVYAEKIDTYLRGLTALAIPLLTLLQEAGDAGLSTDEIAADLDLNPSAATGLLRRCREAGVVESQRRYKQSSLHTLTAGAFRWLVENVHRFRTAGGGVARLDRALLTAQSRAAGEAGRDDPEVARAAEKRLKRTLETRSKTLAALFPQAGAAEIEILLHGENVWRRWTGTPFEVERLRRKMQPYATQGRVIIPSDAKVTIGPNGRLKSEIGDGNVFIPPTGDLAYAISYLMRERVGADLGPAAATEFLQAVERLGVGNQIDGAGNHTEAIAILQHLQIVESNPVPLAWGLA